MVPKPIPICFFRDFKYFTFRVVNYTSLFINCGTKGASGTETYSHMFFKRFPVFEFSSCELYVTVHKMLYQRCQWYQNPFPNVSLKILSILLLQL